MKCPICQGKLVRRKVEYGYGEVSFGKFEADACRECGEAFFTEEASDAIDLKAKELGLWGLERRSKISYSGNSLIVRLPKDLIQKLGWRKGQEVLLRPEGKRRIVIEVET